MTANDASPLSRVIDVLNKNTATLDNLFTDKVFNRLIFFHSPFRFCNRFRAAVYNHVNGYPYYR